MTGTPSIDELVELCAVDNQLYCRTFFERTYRQEFPSFDDEVTELLESPDHRYVGLKMFRGSGKTARLRTLVTKRIAFALSNTILFVSNAEKHSRFSLKWIRKQVEFNTKWSHTFGLSKGATWNDEHLEIHHRVSGRTISVLALGITGSIRGINLDDFRPDFIVLDDPDNEETTNTIEQREKTSDLVFGALQKSLAPPTENPLAKMVILQTPLNKFDLITTCEADAEWHVITISCLDGSGKSTWEARFPTEFLQKEKHQHSRMNKMVLWMREMECKIISAETAAFDVSWLKYWDDLGLPPGLTYYIGIDPASSSAKNADDQVIGVVGIKGHDVYLAEYTAEKGEMPEPAANTFIDYLRRYTVLRAVVESISYQRVLAWYIEQKMRAQRVWCVILQVQDKRKKSDRIIQAIRDKAAHGHLHVSVKHQKFIEQFSDYRPNVEMHDDVLDMVAMVISSQSGYVTLDDEEKHPALDERHIPDLDRGVIEHHAP